jgi:hypothetical protein
MRYMYGDVEPVNYNVVPQYRGGNTTEQLLNEAQHWMVSVVGVGWGA